MTHNKTTNTQATATHHPRILLAKIGLDGHDRGVKVLARSFRDAGIEVIYTGLWQTCEATMYAALQEDVDVIGVSLLSAAHMTVMPEILKIRTQLGVEHIPVVLGGIVPVADYESLKQMGVAAVFNPGSNVDKIIETMNELGRRDTSANVDELRAGYLRGETLALARLITAVVRDEGVSGWSPPEGKGKVLGITGAPGVGKSSFIARLAKRLRASGKKVAVVAIDPSSPLTGGALLGDRLRMMAGDPDEHFFIRSLSSGGEPGGLSPRCRSVVEVLNGFGFEYILVETVGAGQADVGIRELVDHTLLMLMPDSGDAVQFSKAGIMEIADAFILNKCDLAGADATEAQLRGALDDARPVFRVCSLRDEGVDKVVDWVSKL